MISALLVVTLFIIGKNFGFQDVIDDLAQDRDNSIASTKSSIYTGADLWECVLAKIQRTMQILWQVIKRWNGDSLSKAIALCNTVVTPVC